MVEKAKSPMNFRTEIVRGSYIQVFEARANPSGQLRYSIQLLVPKTDTVTLGRMRIAAAEAVKKHWGDTPPVGLRNPLRDGDAERPDQPEYAGHYFVNCSSKQRPGVMDRDAVTYITEESQLVSGDYVICSLGTYTYDNSGNKGVSFGLRNIQFVRKGEPLARSRPEDDFEAIDPASLGIQEEEPAGAAVDPLGLGN